MRYPKGLGKEQNERVARDEESDSDPEAVCTADYAPDVQHDIFEALLCPSDAPMYLNTPIGMGGDYYNPFYYGQLSGGST